MNVTTLSVTTRRILPAIAVLLAGLSTPSADNPAHAQAMDAKEDDWVMVWKEPRHRLVFEKDNIRIISVNIPVGDTSMFHLHDRPTLYVAINGSAMQNQNRGSEWDEPNPGNTRTPGEILYREDYLAKPLNHRVKNIGDQPFRLVGILNFGNGSDPADSEALPDVAAELASNWFRAYRHRLAAGESSDTHVHAHPVVVIQTIMGNSDVTEDGHSVDEKTVSGLFSFHKPGVAHQLHNLGSKEVELVEVEVR
jgi:quercetin dioxygenase-like cupin family protein